MIFLQKPYRVELLLSTLRNLLDDARAAPFSSAQP